MGRVAAIAAWSGGAARRFARRVAGPRPLRRGVIVTMVVVAATGAYGVSLWTRIDRFPLDPTPTADGGTTYLLVGSDSRAFVTTAEDRARYGDPDATPGERADVILALRVDDSGSSRMLLLSRDLLVVDRTGSPVRLNETLLDGPQTLVDTLCSSIGLGVDHVLMLQLGGLRDVVDAIGGLDVTLATPVRDWRSGLDLDGGNLHLDGADVVAFVGSRHMEHLEDDGRWRERAADTADRPGRAAEVLQQIGAELELSPLEPLRSHRILWTTSGSVRMDDSVGVADANALRGALTDLAHVTERDLPVTSSGGALPVDELTESAGDVLEEFDGAGAAGCDEPAFPEARRS